MRPFLRCALLSALLLPAPGVIAQKVVMYRCTDAAGALTVQNDKPCAKGSRQERRVIESIPTVASPPRALPPPAATRGPPPAATAPAPRTSNNAVPTATTTIADADRLPPPVLFECRTYDNDRYLSDDGMPPQRCAPMSTTGIGGGSGPAAGEACQMVSDQCQRIADGALCENWRARLREVQSALRFGRGGDRDSAQAEVDRVTRVVIESTCGR